MTRGPRLAHATQPLIASLTSAGKDPELTSRVQESAALYSTVLYFKYPMPYQHQRGSLSRQNRAHADSRVWSLICCGQSKTRYYCTLLLRHISGLYPASGIHPSKAPQTFREEYSMRHAEVQGGRIESQRWDTGTPGSTRGQKEVRHST